MNLNASATLLPLHRRLRSDHFLHFNRPPALRLRADCGTLWVTVDGEPDDIQIEAGESRVFESRAPITVGTLGGDAVLSATRLVAPRLQRLQAWLRRWTMQRAQPRREALT